MLHFSLVFVFILRLTATCVNGVEQVPCYFIFGDSLFDSGNNNNLPTKAKANYPPYGIDFPEGPTGRFSNGRNIGDVVGEHLGFQNHIPPFATARDNILKGVNYASGGSGIRDETARNNLGFVISMNNQLINHRIIISRIESILRNKATTQEYVGKCIYTVGMGGNDYINNYFLPKFYPTSRQFTPQQYATILIQQYSQQLKTLYDFGARKIALYGLGLIGCTPGSIAMYGTTNGSSCVDSINKAVQIFNTKLISLVDELNNSFKDAKFIYINIFGISSAPAVGITADCPCCQVANLTTNNGVLTCIPFGTTCANRNEFIFWDATHPTEVASVTQAQRAYSAELPSDSYPIDIRRLALL